MQNPSQIFDVLITHEDLELLQKENQELKRIVGELQADNQELNTLIDGLTNDIKKHAPFVQQAIDLQRQTRALSKFVLRLSTSIYSLKQKAEQSATPVPKFEAVDRSDELQKVKKRVDELQQEKDSAVKMKEQIQEQLDITRQMQSELEERLIKQRQYIEIIEGQLAEKEVSQLSLKVKKSQQDMRDHQCQRDLLSHQIKKNKAELEDQDIRMKQKDQTIQDLKQQIALLQQENKLLHTQGEQQKICSDWGLSQPYVQKTKQLYGGHSSLIAQLKRRVRELEEEKESYDYIFQNERNLIEEQRKKLEEREKQFIVKEKQLKQREVQYNHKSQKLEEQLRKRQAALESNYMTKIKSLRDFAECPVCTDQKRDSQKVISHLKKSLEKLDREKALLQNMVDALKQEEPLKFAMLVESELQLLVRSVANSSPKQAREQLAKKEQQWMNLILDRIEEAQAKLNLNNQTETNHP